jgi:DNA topoisomerase-1
VDNQTAEILVIVESPSKGTKIAQYLGPAYHCIASKGHFRELNSLTRAFSLKPGFQPQYTLSPDKRGHVEWMRSEIARFRPSNVVLATDDDREGEAIAWHICDHFGLPVSTTRRIVFHSVTPEALRDAVAAPRVIDMDLVRAAQTRQVLDILVGFKISPFLWKRVPHTSGEGSALSAGRCQTPALRLVYDAHQVAIGNGVAGETGAHPEWKLAAQFFSTNWDFMAEGVKLGSEAEVRAVLAASSPAGGGRHVIQPLLPAKPFSHAPPAPFHTSHLLQVASSRLGLSPKQTMQLCQTLYQNGHITYMRTDAKKYSDEFVHLSQDFLRKHFSASLGVPHSSGSGGGCGIGSGGAVDNANNSSTAISKEAHEAIRPTRLDTMGKLHGELQEDGEIAGDAATGGRSKMDALYELIWTNTVESLLPPFRGYRTHLRISAEFSSPASPGGSGASVVAGTKSKGRGKSSIVVENGSGILPKVVYSRDVEMPEFIGWKGVAQYRTMRDWDAYVAKQRAELAFVHGLKPGSEVVPNRIDACQIETRPPFYYTEASLVEKLEDVGIGRPSTFASLVQTIQDRGYVRKMDLEGRSAVFRDFFCVFGSGLVVGGSAVVAGIRSGDGANGNIQVKESVRKVGAQRGKLVIQPVGLAVLGVLMPTFNELFDYGFTAIMESQLDEIAHGKRAVGIMERECAATIKRLSAPLRADERKVFRVCNDPDVCVAFGKTGPLVYRNVAGGSGAVKPMEGEVDDSDAESGGDADGSGDAGDADLGKSKKEYLPVKSGLQLDTGKLERGEYALEDLVEWTDSCLGQYEGVPIFLKSGKYGIYAEWGEHKESLRAMRVGSGSVNTGKITLNEVVAFLQKKEANGGVVADGKKILRVITPEISVRKGRFGAYVFVQRAGEDAPNFYGMRKGGMYRRFLNCPVAEFMQWLEETHGV